MVLTKRYEYSPLEEIFFPKRTPNAQCYSDEDLSVGDKGQKRKVNPPSCQQKKTHLSGRRNKNVHPDINQIKDELLQPELSLELCQRKKNYYLNTRHANHVQSYFFFYDYRKCFLNMDGKMFIDRHPVRIWNDDRKRDERLKKAIPVQNYNSFIYAYNI
ncbi:conserved Plasmodium protein, unknown function [Plasmodium knowlesi strain H]|uniref:Uncharacterized protein n=3 Tax=Plasmodium knowlesi TaxID=5850 RepID=A0A5E7WU86_PLAKH|nr:conserved Plasmodium protein, unknown function [Plasmodium knowlesi strain H]OTN68753.1 Uncharacterized protein PKNOH_S01024400 [Plasmodium knowlesi]CAA9986241.1 conserved Plasmodium protein, unknown function [Plasmodium knowlesi strain H]SBO25452.1 conserved Plasmodium protein, unknown function [Plasmodium knowlesi strain H]SBO27731.1 conserved Plasmodium protein, unknown function [Plasmodium knowlesi strain H]VVS75715.1 conserved Plasmodium protein, unknown function [Plasmodium knowlesi s